VTLFGGEALGARARERLERSGASLVASDDERWLGSETEFASDG